MLITITRLDPEVPMPAYQTDGAAAFDLSSNIDATVPPRSSLLLPTGLIIATPPGHVLMLTARSSLFKKKGLMLANGVGTIDSDYCGPEDELKLSVFNPGDTPVAIQKHERLAQGLIIPIIRAEFMEGPPADKSRGGFGTTG